MRDVDMIFQNALLYHTRVKRIQEVMHKAYEFRDYAGALLNTIPSVSKLNYWQLKMWSMVKDKLYSLSGIKSDKFTLNEGHHYKDNKESRFIDKNDVCGISMDRRMGNYQENMPKLINGQTSPRYSDEMGYYSPDEKYRGLNKKGNVETETPLVRRRRYKIPVDEFSSDEEVVNVKPDNDNEVRKQSQDFEQPHCQYPHANSEQKQVNGKLEKIKKLDNINQNMSQDTDEHISIEHCGDPTLFINKKTDNNLDTEDKDDKKNTSNVENQLDDNINSSDEDVYDAQVKLDDKLLNMLNRVVAVSQKLPLNDTITLSSVLWNVLSMEEEGEDFSEKLTSNLDSIISNIQNTVLQWQNNIG